MNVDKIFDAVANASSYVHLMDAIQKKKASIADCTSRKCGNCSRWMTRACAPEKQHGKFMSCNSMGCKEFDLEMWCKELAEERRLELSKLQAALAAAKEKP